MHGHRPRTICGEGFPGFCHASIIILNLLNVYKAHGAVIVGGARDGMGQMKQHAALAQGMKKVTRAMKEATSVDTVLAAMEAVASCEVPPACFDTECASFAKALKARGTMVVQNLASSTLQACKQLVHDGKNGAVVDSTRGALSTCCQLATRAVSVCGSVSRKRASSRSSAQRSF